MTPRATYPARASRSKVPLEMASWTVSGVETDMLPTFPARADLTPGLRGGVSRARARCRLDALSGDAEPQQTSAEGDRADGEPGPSQSEAGDDVRQPVEV